MMKVLDEIALESAEGSAYPDEQIASSIYLVSLSYSLRALDGMDSDEREEKRGKNAWLEKMTEKVHDVPVLSFDNITRKLANGKSSCDAVFYNFSPEEGEQHYLVELKNANKQTALSLMKDMGKDGIYNKIRDSVQMIQKQLEFGGKQEHDEMIGHMHFCVVYAGKNDVISREPVEKLKRTKVSRDKSGKQKRAGRMNFDSEKRESETYERFGKMVQSLRLDDCSEATFPGDALPRAKKVKGSGRVRLFSLFSAQDFAEIIENDFFSDWKWGSYQKYFSPVRLH